MATHHSSWINYINNLIYRGIGSIPDPTKFRMCLSTSGTVTRSSQKASFICSELSQENGYQRKSIVYSATSNFYNTELRDRFDPVTAIWTASGGTLQFSSLFLLANCAAVANMPCTIVSGAVSAAAHGLIAGDEVCFNNISGAFPPEIQTSTLYKVLAPTANSFSIATIAAPTVPIAISVSSGTFRLNNATGAIVEFHIEDNPRTRQDGMSYSIEVNRAWGDMTYGNGI